MAEMDSSSLLDNGEIPLDRDARAVIMRALLIGLHAYGELDRIANAAQLFEIGGEKVPESLRPVAVSAAGDEIDNFAQALRFAYLV